MYGLCKATYTGSRPSGMHCQICRMKDDYYKCPWKGNQYTGQKWMDAEWILRLLGTTHIEERADRIQTYPFLCMATFKLEENLIGIWLYENYARMWLKDHPRERYFGNWTKILEKKGGSNHQEK
jgi:hypothetical protein